MRAVTDFEVKRPVGVWNDLGDLDGSHDRFSHFVPRAVLVEAMVTGTAVVALCGKTWVPSRDPERYPVCPDCKRIHDDLPDERTQP